MNELPRPPWRISEQEISDRMYDTLSDAVRADDPTAVEEAWIKLDDRLRDGAPLPSPWRRMRPAGRPASPPAARPG